MFNGVVNDETLAHVLRNISQKRQHGVLELKYRGSELEVYFFQGRIFDARPKGVSPAAIIGQRLTRAGFLEEGISLSGEDYNEVFDDLQKHIPAFKDRVAFRKLVEHSVLDVLYELQFPDEAIYTFNAQMIGTNRDLCPSISVGQLLLDLVSIRDDRDEYREVFDEQALVEPGTARISDLSDEQAEICKYLTEPIHHEELYLLSCLNRFHFQEALMDLYQRGAVVTAKESSNGSVKSASNGHTLEEPDSGSLTGDILDAFLNDDNDEIEDEHDSIPSISDAMMALQNATESLQGIGESVSIEAAEKKTEKLEAKKPDRDYNDRFFAKINARLLQSNIIITTLNLVFILCIFGIAFITVMNQLGFW